MGSAKRAAGLRDDTLASLSASDSAPLDAIAARLQDVCLARGVTVSAAESCTGGLLAATITSVPGSSGYFDGSIVSYANEAKTALLGVDPAILEAHGAVSAQVARAMADGARSRFGANIAVSITGVSGPGGGSAEKPVGLTYLGLASPAGSDVRRFHWTGDRATNRVESVRAALDWLIEAAEGPEAVEAGQG